MSSAAPVDPDRVSALILAAGQGTRLGEPKAFLETKGEALVQRAVRQVRPFAAEIVVGLPEEDLERAADLLSDAGLVLAAGGATRHETVERLLARARRPLILLHEVARPLTPPALFGTVLAAADAFGAATAYVAASRRDSLALREGEFLVAPLRRDRVIRSQTPQAFRRELVLEIFRLGQANGWNEPSNVPALFARAGHRVRLVPGDPDNLKITFPEDWATVRARLAE